MSENPTTMKSKTDEDQPQAGEVRQAANDECGEATASRVRELLAEMLQTVTENTTKQKTGEEAMIEQLAELSPAALEEVAERVASIIRLRLNDEG